MNILSSLVLCFALVGQLKLAVNGHITEVSVAPGPQGALLVKADELTAVTGAALADDRLTWFGISVELDGIRPAGHTASPQVSLDLRAVAGAFGWQLKQRDALVELWAPGASVAGVRQGYHSDRVRVVIDLSGPAVYQARSHDGRVVVMVPPGEGSIASAGELRLFEFDGDRAARITSEILQDGWTKIVILPPAPCRYTVFNLSDPARIVVDLFETGPEAPAASPARRQPGPTHAPAAPRPREKWWRVLKWPTPAGEAMVHVLTVDPVHEMELRPALAGPVVNSRAPVSAIARAQGALAAVNGGFFSPRHGVPLGMLVINGEWLRAPLPRRPVLAIMRDGRCEIARVQWRGRVEFSGLGSLPLLGLNQNHWEPDSVVAFTHRWGAKVPGAKNATRLIVSSRGRVIFRETSGRPVPVPARGMVISGIGKRAKSLCKVPLGCRVALRFDLRPKWPNLLHAVGGGPLLVAGGVAVLDPKTEGFRSDVASGRHARTAVGIRADGRVLLVAVEGRPNGRGPGLTLWELTKLMLKLGAISAMNLDGGSSTTLVVHDRVVTACAGGTPRLVNNAIVVLPRSLRPRG